MVERKHDLRIMSYSKDIWENFVKVILTVLFFLTVGFLYFAPVESGDVWWHLSSGQWMLEHLSVPHFDPFSFQGEPSPWSATHWMGSSIYYAVYQLGSFSGLKFFRVLIFLSVIGIFARYSYRKLPYPFLFTLAYLMAYGLLDRGFLRPFVFNFIFIQIFLIQLMAYEEHSRRKVLYVLPFLGMIWGNLHLGCFVYGVMLIGIFLFSAALKLIHAKSSRQSDEQVHSAYKGVRDLSLVLLLFLLSLMISPYGINGLLHPLKVFLLPSFINFYKFNHIIAEVQPPVYLFTVAGLPFILLFLMTLVVLIKNRKHSLAFTQFLLFSVSLFLFLQMRRGSALFVIICVYIIVQQAQQCHWYERWRARHNAKRDGILVTGILICIFCVHTLRTAYEHVSVDGQTKKIWRLDVHPQNPVAAVNFLNSLQIEGNVFANDPFGNYLSLFGYPQLRAFVDGRQLNQSHFDMYLKILNQPQQYWDVAVQAHHFTIAMIDAISPLSTKIVKHLAQHLDWQLIFIDGNSLIFVKRGAYPLPDNIQNLEEALRSQPWSQNDIAYLNNHLQKSSRNGFEEILLPRARFIDSLIEGASLFEMGFRGASVEKLKEVVVQHKHHPQVHAVIRKVVHDLESNIK